MYGQYWEGGEEDDTWQIVSPVEYREEIMKTASVTGGHMDVKKSQTKVAKRAYWIGSGGREMYVTSAGGVISARNTIAVPSKNRENSKTCAWEHRGKESPLMLRDLIHSRARVTSSWLRCWIILPSTPSRFLCAHRTQ